MNQYQFDGIHYETGSVHNAFTLLNVKMPHTSLPPSEALLLGLSGGITFGYFSFAYKGIDPHVALLTRNTFSPLENLFNRLGVSRVIKQTTNAAKAESNLVNALEDGQPVLVWVDQMSLPYGTYDGSLGEPMYEMIPVVVFSYDTRKSTFDIADQSRVPMKISASDLSRARARIKKMKFRQMTLSLTSLNKLSQGVASGLRASIQSFYITPVKGHANNFGFAAYQRWADVLINKNDKQAWDRIFPTGRPLFAGLISAFERIELFGTGGAASRPLFADFLDEASLLLVKPALQKSAMEFRTLSRLWNDLGLALLPDEFPLLKETRQLMLKKRDLFWEFGAKASPEIKKIHKRLNQIRTGMEKNPPMSESGVMNLKENLREKILAVRDAEMKAFTSLEKTFIL